MVNREELKNYCNTYLDVDKFKDYCPNGLQIEGSLNITKIVTFSMQITQGGHYFGIVLYKLVYII